MKNLVLILILALLGCNYGARTACYAENDAAYWQTVEQCATEDYGPECPYLPEAEAKQAAADKLCP